MIKSSPGQLANPNFHIHIQVFGSAKDNSQKEGSSSALLIITSVLVFVICLVSEQITMLLYRKYD